MPFDQLKYEPDIPIPDNTALGKLMMRMGGYNSPQPQDMRGYKRFVTQKVHPLDQKNAMTGMGDYDYYGLFSSLMGKPSQYNSETHFPDKYKKPNHPTFSTESMYAGHGLPGQWVGNEYLDNPYKSLINTLLGGGR